MSSAAFAIIILVAMMSLPWTVLRSIDTTISFEDAVSVNVPAGLYITVLGVPIFTVTRPLVRITVNHDGLLLMPMWGLPPTLAVRWTDMSFVDVKPGRIRFSLARRPWLKLSLVGLPLLSLGGEGSKGATE